jgi:hypothetical protein
MDKDIIDPIECPECHAELHVHELIEKDITYKIGKDGRSTIIEEDDNSGGWVSCSSGKPHRIPQEIASRALKAKKS